MSMRSEGGMRDKKQNGEEPETMRSVEKKLKGSQI